MFWALGDRCNSRKFPAEPPVQDGLTEPEVCHWTHWLKYLAEVRIRFNNFAGYIARKNLLKIWLRWMIFIGNIWLNYRLILRIFVGDITCKSWLNQRIEKWANGPSGVGFIFLGHLFWRFNTSFLRATKFYVLRPNFLEIEIGVQIELQGEEVSLEWTTYYTMTNISFICFIYYYS